MALLHDLVPDLVVASLAGTIPKAPLPMDKTSALGGRAGRGVGWTVEAPHLVRRVDFRTSAMTAAVGF